MILDLETHVKAQASDSEQRIQSLLDQHTSQVTSTKDEHLQTQIENAKLHSQV